MAEARPSVGVLRSRFSSKLWKAYVESPLPPCMVYKESAPEHPHTRHPVSSNMAVDIVRSRYNALYEIPDPGLPVFTALDDMRPVSPDEALPDLVYIDTGATATDFQSLLHALPYHGPAWYLKPAVEYLLHTSKATWADLRWGVTASAHLAGDVLRGAFDVMEKAWEDVVQAGESPNRTTPAKDSINCWVGTCGMRLHPSLRTHLSFEKGAFDRTTEDAYGVKGLFEYSRETKTLDSGSYRVVYDWCLCVEHVRLAQAHQACVAVYKAIRLPFPVLHLVVDGFIWERPRKAVTAGRLKTLLESLSFGCLPRLEDHVRAEMAAPDPKQKRFLVDLYPLSGRASDKKVFRVVVPQARQHLRGEFKMEKVMRNWPVSPPAVFRSALNMETSRERVLAGESLFVEAWPELARVTSSEAWWQNSKPRGST